MVYIYIYIHIIYIVYSFSGPDRADAGLLSVRPGAAPARPRAHSSDAGDTLQQDCCSILYYTTVALLYGQSSLKAYLCFVPGAIRGLSGERPWPGAMFWPQWRSPPRKLFAHRMGPGYAEALILKHKYPSILYDLVLIQIYMHEITYILHTFSKVCGQVNYFSTSTFLLENKCKMTNIEALT